MFEKKEIDLKYENLNRTTYTEVVTSLKLQIEKYHAQVQVSAKGDSSLVGDKPPDECDLQPGG